MVDVDPTFPNAGNGKDGYMFSAEAIPVAVSVAIFQHPLSLGSGFTTNSLDLSQPRHKALIRAMELDPVTQILTLYSTDACAVGKGRAIKVSPSYWAFVI